MLVCPQCQFENSPANPICQTCGTSLTLHACPDCGTLVPFTTLNCPQCRGVTGQVLRVVLAKTINPAESLPEQGREDDSLLSFPFKDGFLDANQRYQLLGLPKDVQHGFQSLSSSPGQQFFQGSVLDCQPLQQSEFAHLLKQSTTILDNQSGLNSWSELPGSIPEIAYPYLKLQAGLPTLPMPTDAWQVDPWAVLLLPDRSHWQTLSDLIASQPLPMLQILYWLNEMITLWAALEPIANTQSLLISDNLRIDEDQTLGLCQLYPNLKESLPSLLQLVHFWKTVLLAPASGDAIAPLVQLCDRLLSEASVTLDELQAQLQNLADQEQQISPPPPATLPDRSQDKPGKSPEVSRIMSEGSGSELSTEVLAMKLFALSETGATECGQQRQHNEDYFGIDSQITLQQTNQTRQLHGKGLYIVCDGMGGHADGEVASVLAVNTLRDYFREHWQDDALPTVDRIKAGIWQANQVLYQVNQQNANQGAHRMGTTLGMLFLSDTTVAIAHVGDSRIYRVSRQLGLEQLTLDHEVGQKAIQSGLAPTLAYAQPGAHQLTQALGPLDCEYVRPDVRYFDIQEDTLFLLCSDGLSDNELVETYWETLLLPLLSSNAQLDLGIHQLIEFANQYNGHDNITALLVRIKVRPPLRH